MRRLYYHFKDHGQFTKVRQYVSTNSIEKIPAQDGKGMSSKAQKARGFIVDHKDEEGAEALLYCRVWFSRATKFNGGRPTVARLVQENGVWKMDVSGSMRLTAKISKGKTSLGFHDGTKEWWK